MIFRGTSGARPADVQYPALFDDRIGRMPDTAVFTPKQAAARWDEGAPLHVVPVAPAGAVIPWAITARPGRDFVVTEYAGDGRPAESVRWEQTGALIRRVGGAAWFSPEAQGQGPLPTAYEVRWRSYADGMIRVETIGPTVNEDHVTVLRRVTGEESERPSPGLESLTELRESRAPDTPTTSDPDPRSAAAEYLRVVCSGAVPRPEAEAFSPTSLLDGAVVLATTRQIAELVARIQPGDEAVFDVSATPWIPVLRRGPLSIIPLGAQGSLPAHRAAVAAELRELADGVRGALEFRAGARVGLDLVAAGYGRSLAAAGAERAGVWRDAPGRAVILVASGDLEVGTATVALHIVPGDWVSADPPAEATRADAGWSWSEVVALYAARPGADAAGTAGSLTGADEQERDS